MCRGHWRKVSLTTQQAVHAAWRRVNEVDQNDLVWDNYRIARQDAIDEAAA